MIPCGNHWPNCRPVALQCRKRFAADRQQTFFLYNGSLLFQVPELFRARMQTLSQHSGEKIWRMLPTVQRREVRFKFADRKLLVWMEIGIQIERPDRSNGVLFDNLTGIDNLSISLLSKAGKRIATGRVKESILDEASRWFPREALQQPLRTWPLPERLRFSYCKWYLLNPKLLICFFPFAGQEPAHHEMIIEMLVSCAERGMAVWVISSGIDAICEKTENQEFLRRLRYLN